MKNVSHKTITQQGEAWSRGPLFSEFNAGGAHVFINSGLALLAILTVIWYMYRRNVDFLHGANNIHVHNTNFYSNSSMLKNRKNDNEHQK